MTLMIAFSATAAAAACGAYLGSKPENPYFHQDPACRRKVALQAEYIRNFGDNFSALSGRLPTIAQKETLVKYASDFRGKEMAVLDNLARVNGCEASAAWGHLQALGQKMAGLQRQLEAAR